MDAIADAIALHGARAVHDAAFQRLRNNPGPLADIGLTAETIGDADRIMAQAFRALSKSDRDADHASTVAALETARIAAK